MMDSQLIRPHLTEQLCYYGVFRIVHILNLDMDIHRWVLKDDSQCCFSKRRST